MNSCFASSLYIEHPNLFNNGYVRAAVHMPLQVTIEVVATVEVVVTVAVVVVIGEEEEREVTEGK